MIDDAVDGVSKGHQAFIGLLLPSAQLLNLGGETLLAQTELLGGHDGGNRASYMRSLTADHAISALA